MKNQMTFLYYNVIQQRCELEKEILTNTLSFALQPNEFAYRLMKGPGFMAVTAGETIHAIKCVPVDVLVRKTDKCYVELPVTAPRASHFLTPKSRIKRFGTEKECSHELPTLYHIENKWIQITPHPQVRQLPPQQLTPMTTLSWEYHLTPGPLAVSGIYSEKDIEKLSDHIMFPAEKLY